MVLHNLRDYVIYQLLLINQPNTEADRFLDGRCDCILKREREKRRPGSWRLQKKITIMETNFLTNALGRKRPGKLTQLSEKQ